MTSTTSYDPDVAAAFGAGPVSVPTAAAASRQLDPDVAAAFPGHSASRLVWNGPPEPGLQTLYPAAAGTVSNAITQGGRAMTQAAVSHGITNPYIAGAIGTLPAAAAAVGSLALGGVGAEAEDAATVGAEHPLMEAAQTEAARVAGIRQSATNAGFQLTEKTLSPTQQIVNKLSRDDLDMPTAAVNGIDAPLYPKMFQAANAENVSPAYDAMRAYPIPAKLSPYTQATLADVRQMMPTKEAATLPTGDSMPMSQLVDQSIALRAKAKQFPDTGVNANNQTYQSIAQAHIDAARALENDARTTVSNNGDEELADNWDAARIYRAKSGAYEDALDGAGNVLPTVLKKQLLKAGVPLSDNAEMMANIAASHPELFRPVPTAPAPGLMKKAAAATLPVLGAGAGSYLSGPAGAIAGSVIGEHYGQKLLTP